MDRTVPGGDPPTGAQDVAGFERFFAEQHRAIGRLAYLLVGEHGEADDLTGDVFLAVWRQWRRVCELDAPLAYVRRMTVNMAASRVRRRVRERRRDGQLEAVAEQHSRQEDGAAVLDVRAALQSLPVRRRACVVLRYAFDLGEREVAELLGISVGTVKSQTSKGVAQLRRLLDPEPPRSALPPGDGAGLGARRGEDVAELRSLGLRWPA